VAVKPRRFLRSTSLQLSKSDPWYYRGTLLTIHNDRISPLPPGPHFDVGHFLCDEALFNGRLFDDFFSMFFSL
jgi:hypothetical protein